jgi:hypothetical protein
MHFNGFNAKRDPILEPIQTIRNTDAIIDLSDTKNPKEPDWPEADVIVGNPPFLGNKQMRAELGTEYVEALWKLYGDRLPASSDLCCYWFEKARRMTEQKAADRCGLLASAGIRQTGNRRVLDRICETADLFWAISDREWLLDGASVRISIVAFTSRGQRLARSLDGREVDVIHADLTSGAATTLKQTLRSNTGRCFMGVTKVGDFDIEHSIAIEMLARPSVAGRCASDVLRPFRNGSDIVRKPSDRWIIDFGTSMPVDVAASYDAPFEYLVQHVKAERLKNNRKAYSDRWWIHAESRPAFRRAVAAMARYVATARVAKHRIFVWFETVVLPDSKVIAIAFDDDQTFGLLCSRVHEAWTRATCGWHGVGNDATYNPTTCFETFPFPEPTAAQRDAIAAAAYELDILRSTWLNPPEWTREDVLTFPGSVDGPWARYVTEPNAKSIGTVRYPRVVPADDAAAKKLAKRTLTNLYNERPTWLDLAHKRLDEAVFAAYGWPANLSDDDLLARLLALNLERSGKE